MTPGDSPSPRTDPADRDRDGGASRRPGSLRLRLLIEVDIDDGHRSSAPDLVAGALDGCLAGIPGVIGVGRLVTASVLGTPHPAGRVRGVFDLNSRELVVDGAVARLSPRESAVLCHLVRRPGDAVSREELRDALDDADGSLGPRAVDVILSRLRAKLPLAPPPLVTVRGVGYRYSPSPQFLVLHDTP
ncbi:winged helix-turn-helix domain-containing protein [Streptomyces tremellae]|uniref:OmpR/PhoB-type domain-containing protein n=1 Tax=Streptomyces tremellae TaxID=1124239 RepID=A0ABP7G2S2_9ACTN